MKKFVVMTLAAAAVVGCSKENVKPGGEGAESQKLNVLTSIQTIRIILKLPIRFTMLSRTVITRETICRGRISLL